MVENDLLDFVFFVDFLENKKIEKQSESSKKFFNKLKMDGITIRPFEMEEEPLKEVKNEEFKELPYHKQPIPKMIQENYDIKVTKDSGITKKIIIKPSNESNFLTIGSRAQSLN